MIPTLFYLFLLALVVSSILGVSIGLAIWVDKINTDTYNKRHDNQ